MTEKQIQTLYKKYNRKYFDGKLPSDVPVKFVDMSKTTHCGLATMFAESGLLLQVIYIDSWLKERELIMRFSLLHEMCHVKLQPTSLDPDPHGKEFDDEMNRLAFRGAFKGLW